ncbi:hypothetical protein L593_09940 [Salinarchaeum sp. Harcht-Bsk1]|uniref:DUF7269 family protein n=1 Tax=Salinarchaeum sp. Harcht-Bsk1 TaxID=1333523 RepID=UPI0003422954|nr:hypothetical protein [Salinarchaeum sp. Harcht-Bsk1]AGN01933.1 hypothetical protein L593_09940 [Salinarchaeum sp. Harcht-Bsk1]
MRRLMLAIGSASTAAGATLVLTPMSAPVAPPVVPALGLVVVLGLALGGLGAVRRARERPAATSLADTRDRTAVDAPGDAFDRTLASISARVDEEERAPVRDRLAATAVQVVADAEDCSRETARRRIDRGTWTDDRAAVAFFADSVEHAPSLRERVRRVLAGEPTFAVRARRVIDELADREREP